MRLTPYHARYFALMLSRRLRGAERFLPALATATIDLHPHQVDAAVFGCRSPYRDGVILADEEGLGKTVEAGIVLLQYILEDRNRLLVLCPASLTEFWRNELETKLSLPVVPLGEAPQTGGVVIMSHQKASRNADALAAIPWDLCVLDEAHHLANAGALEHVQANAIHAALQGRTKLLLTATPMQNSLLDLYYLVRCIDDTTFPDDPEIFRARYMAKRSHRQELASRAQLLCQRTLRRQALTMPQVRRTVRTILVTPSPEEEELSKRLSRYFHRETLRAFPKVEEHRIRLTYWKMLASSPQALHGSLIRLCERLATDPEADEELHELRAIAGMAEAIWDGSRVKAFATALDESLSRLRQAGAPEKVVVFSENTGTLEYLRSLLTRLGYDRVIPYYGGTRSKRALADFTRGRGRILLTTDGAATGLDLTSCALVINYDLPWNMQKLEQRISRCHRYGQKHDVMVVNFLDPTNRADRRLYDSLNKKLERFDTLFGASETVLGKVADPDEILPDRRSADEVRADHVRFTEEHRPEIEHKVDKAEEDLLAHFDEEVRQRFAKYGEMIPAALSKIDYWLWELTKYRLRDRASFDEMKRSFVLGKSPYQDLRLHRVTFGMARTLPPGERYHLGHPLARRILADCREGELDYGTMLLEAGEGIAAGLAGEIGLWQIGMTSDVAYVTEPVLCGVTGGGEEISPEQCASLLKLDVVEWQGGAKWHADEGETYRGRVWRGATPDDQGKHGLRNERLDTLRDQVLEEVRQRLSLDHDATLQAELDRLRQWAEDEEAALKERQTELRRRIAEAKSKSEATPGYVQRFRTNQQAVALEKRRRQEEERLLLLAAEVRRKRDARIEEARRKSQCRFWDEEMFVVKFEVVDNTAVTNKVGRHGT